MTPAPAKMAKKPEMSPEPSKPDFQDVVEDAFYRLFKLVEQQTKEITALRREVQAMNARTRPGLLGGGLPYPQLRPEDGNKCTSDLNRLMGSAQDRTVKAAGTADVINQKWVQATLGDCGGFAP